MPRNSGHADLPLHTGTVPRWLADRMMVLGTLITEAIVENYGPDEILVRLSDPLWFQSFGSVMGMDWHSSGITTSVMYALKRGLNPRAKELGLYVCGGRGKYSRQTPDELAEIAALEGLDGEHFIRNSKLVAKVDNNAVQDGFQLYQHNFILSKTGNWAVVQQGMNVDQKKARRYHWSSSELRSFVEEPHTAIVGENHGEILNLTDKQAKDARSSILEMSKENPDRILKEISQIQKPASQMILLQGGESLPLGSKPSFSPTPSSGAANSASAISKSEESSKLMPRNAPVPLQGELFPDLFPQETLPASITESQNKISLNSPASKDLPQSRNYQALFSPSSNERSFCQKTANGASKDLSQSRDYQALLSPSSNERSFCQKTAKGASKDLSQSRDYQALFSPGTSERSFCQKTANGASKDFTQSRDYQAPFRHFLLPQDIDLKRLGGVLATSYESQPGDFEELLLTKGLGPRTLQSLALVSEIIYGTPARFTDPARFSFAHGGKDGHPFPVPLKIYDESIRILRDSIEKSKLGYKDKSDCIRRLHLTALAIERNCAPQVDFDAAIRFEKEHSREWDGRTV